MPNDRSVSGKVRLVYAAFMMNPAIAVLAVRLTLFTLLSGGTVRVPSDRIVSG